MEMRMSWCRRQTPSPCSAKLSIFPDASHGGIFQYADVFVDQALGFLAE
jgi:hypothetical protein